MHRELGFRWFRFTATNNRVQTTAIKQECKQSKIRKIMKTLKQVQSFISSWQIKFPDLVLVDTDNSMLCTVCIGRHNILSNFNKSINLSYRYIQTVPKIKTSELWVRASGLACTHTNPCGLVSIPQTKTNVWI